MTGELGNGERRAALMGKENLITTVTAEVRLHMTGAAIPLSSNVFRLARILTLDRYTTLSLRQQTESGLSRALQGHHATNDVLQCNIVDETWNSRQGNDCSSTILGRIVYLYDTSYLQKEWCL